MERPPAPTPSPAFLPLGAVVGPWRVVGWAGQGVHGAVYRAVRVGQEEAEPVALKVALLPRDPRFARAVELLRRTHHPSIPGLVDAGEWKHPSGTLHPYIATRWVDGVPLYDQAREHPPTSQEVFRLLAQLSRALQALHAQGALHRDVKGDNVLVRRTDSRAILTDFGSGTYAGAASLTPQQLPPGTPAYRAPEAWLFELRFSHEPSARYVAGPADDLYALGVTACRLVTGEYPEPGAPWKDESGTWQLDTVVTPAALLSDGRVEPRLRAWILRLLSVRPEERGTAKEVAEALERAAEPVGSETSEARAGTRGGAASRGSRGHAGGLWLAMAAAGVALAVSMWGSAPGPRREEPVGQADTAVTEQPDAGTVGLGDSAATASTEDASELPAPEVMAEEPLPELQPGQAQPDAKGRCPHERLVALNGGCWVESSLDSEACTFVHGQMFKGTCYLPFIPPKRRPTSSPGDEQ